MFPDALINRVKAAIAGVADTKAAPTRSAQQESLKQTEALAHWSGEDFSIGPVRLQTMAVGDELIPGDIARVMVGNGDAPLVLRHEAQMGCDLSVHRDCLAR